MTINDLLQTFVECKPITKGWSVDQKYCVAKADGEKYLLRISDVKKHEKQKMLFEMMQKVAALGVPMCMPVEFDVCIDGVYLLQSWIEGEDLEVVLPRLSSAEQYSLGVKAGDSLRKIHTIPAPDTQEALHIRYNRYIDAKIQKYRECGRRFEGDEKVIVYIEQNRYLLKSRPQTYQHGDYQVGNMMVENGKLKIIDFSYGFGDPWEEFEAIRWCVDRSPHFASGMVNGYFSGEVPGEFWEVLLFYFCVGMFHNILWGIEHGEGQVEEALRHICEIFEWTDGLRNPVPIWYEVMG